MVREQIVSSNRFLDEHFVVFFLITEDFVNWKNVKFVCYHFVVISLGDFRKLGHKDLRKLEILSKFSRSS